MTTRLERFTRKAREEPRLRFLALMGMLYDPEGLREGFERKDGSKARKTKEPESPDLVGGGVAD